jgi:hypothetical protein
LEYGDWWGERYIDLVDQAAQRGPSAVPLLRNAILETQRRGCEVYFIKLLDLSSKDWEAFLGNRCGVLLSEFEEYRRSSEAVTTLGEASDLVTLRRLSSPLQ